MIRSFRHKRLARFFGTNDARGVPPQLARRCKERLTVLHTATRLDEIAVRPWRLHRLKGDAAGRHAIDVNGPWRITFEWGEDGHVREVDLEQYH